MTEWSDRAGPPPLCPVHQVPTPEGEAVVGDGRRNTDAVLPALDEVERRLAPGGP